MQSQPTPGFLPGAPRKASATTWQAPAASKAVAQGAMPVNAALAANPAMQPKIRAQAADTPTATALVMPSPETLGVGAGGAALVLPTPATVASMTPTTAAPAADWNDLHERLRRLGAVGFHLDQVAAGQWRATFLLPVGGQQTRHVEASAGSDAAAVAGALREAETLARRGQ